MDKVQLEPGESFCKQRRDLMMETAQAIDKLKYNLKKLEERKVLLEDFRILR